MSRLVEVAPLGRHLRLDLDRSDACDASTAPGDPHGSTLDGHLVEHVGEVCTELPDGHFVSDHGGRVQNHYCVTPVYTRVMHADDETWVPIAGTEELYHVSDRGRIRSARRGFRDLALHQRSNGYQTVGLQVEGRRRTFYVHHLVAAAYIGPRGANEQVRHLNGEPSDNRAANLAYGTARDNDLDKVEHGTHGSQLKADRCNRGHLLRHPNLSISNPKRTCLACARSRRVPPGFAGTRNELAEQWYEAIMTYGRDESVSVMGFVGDRKTANGYLQWNCKLSWSTVDRIRLWHQEGRSGASIAKELGVSDSTVLRVVRGEAWPEHKRAKAEAAAASPVPADRADGRGANRPRRAS